jgi:hypothetical protein
MPPGIGAVGLAKLLEDPGQFLGGNAGARVREAEEEPAFPGGGAECRPALPGELGGVAQEVHQDPSQEVGIGPEGRGEVGGDLHGEGEALLVEERLRLLRQSPQEGPEVHLLLLDLEGAPLELGQVQKVVDRFQELAGVPVEELQAAGGAGTEGCRVGLEGLGGDEDGRQRGPEFVGDVGQELLLEPGGILKPGHRTLQFQVLLLELFPGSVELADVP